MATTSRLLQGHDTADSRDNGVSDSLDIEPIDVDDSDLEDSSEHASGDADSEGEATEQGEDNDTELGKSSRGIFDVIGLSVI
jgi:hypothetical protein